MKKKYPFEKRPTCSCGVKMKLVEYKGYYDEFTYWDCENCNLIEELEKKGIDADKSWRGAYR